MPPYIRLDVLEMLGRDIRDRGASFTQGDLEKALARMYEAWGLAAMVVSRYPHVPVIKDYRVTIGEAIEAHFLGLDHVAVGGLVPVIEGAAKRLADGRRLRYRDVKGAITVLLKSCKQQAIKEKIGVTNEIVAMMDGFLSFATDHLYVNSEHYPLPDGTNRHGITHGTFTDADYGAPINFYKTIAAVDLLTFVSSFRENISWFAPDGTPASGRLALYYEVLGRVRASRPAPDGD